MIKFFRRIRYDLMEKNKTGKYLKYAFGEIVLVVIGILIALQINNWNQGRIESNEEQAALINLGQDFEYNLKVLDSLIDYEINIRKLQFTILSHTGTKPKPKTEIEFNVALNTATHLAEFYPRNGSLDDLLNSGNLGIIKNRKLRKSLSSWKPILDQIKAREKIAISEIEEIEYLISKKGSWLNIDAVSNSKTIENNFFPESGFDVDNRNLLNELEFENTIENVIFQNDLIINRWIQAINATFP